MRRISGVYTPYVAYAPYIRRISCVCAYALLRIPSDAYVYVHGASRLGPEETFLDQAVQYVRAGILGAVDVINQLQRFELDPETENT